MAVMKRTFQGLMIVLTLAIVAGGIVYAQDPLYWRRTVSLFTDTDPAYMNFEPTEKITGNGAYVLPVAVAAERTISSEALDDARAYAADFDSFALIVIHRGMVQTKWYAPGWGRDRITQSQSMHKSVAALMIGAAIDDGAIPSVETPVKTYITEWSGDARGDITIENLLVMSSGLEKFAFTLNPFAEKSSFKFLNSSDRLPHLLSAQQEWEPGGKFDYNDINAALVAVIVERATGKRYADYLEEKLWRPMGGQTAEVWLDREDGLAMTACCLLAPAMDWARLGVMVKDRGRINGRQTISAAWIDGMLTPSPQSDRYGYFTWLGYTWQPGSEESDAPHAQTEPFVSDDIIMFSGRGGQRVFISRLYDLVVVRLGPAGGAQPLKAGWDNSYLVNTLIRGIKADQCLLGFC